MYNIADNIRKKHLKSNKLQHPKMFLLVKVFVSALFHLIMQFTVCKYEGKFINSGNGPIIMYQ